MTAPDTAHYAGIAARLSIPHLAFIDGEPCQARQGLVFETLSPATGAVLGTVAHCQADDVDRAVIAARRVFDAGVWSRAAPEHRKTVLLKLASLVREHAEELAVLECVDSGKTISDCLNEIGNEVPNFFQWYAELIDKSFGKVAPTGETALALIVKEPIGVVGLVLPWNFPLLMAAWKLAPALAASSPPSRRPCRRSGWPNWRPRRACRRAC
jgi:aldehyde dehydrogenase (NAD+)/gamma-glutamyl-gamma-aminobutyraldehyde dehydrogenase